MNRLDIEERDREFGICDNCGHECEAKRIDMGIGPYEFWGDKGVHHDWQYVSPCCETRMVEGGESIVRKAVHTARRDHKDGRIKRGDRYALTVYRSYRKNGPCWIHTEKRKVG